MAENDLPDPNVPGHDKTLTGQKMIFGAALLIIIALQLYSMAKQNHPAPSLTAPTANAPANSETLPSGATQNNAVPTEDVPVSFRIPGVVTEIFFAERMPVKQGQLLATLDKAPFEEALTAARAQLKAAMDEDAKSNPPNPNFSAIEAARATVEAAQHTYDEAHKELIKKRELLVTGEKDNVYEDDVQNEHDAELNLERTRRELAQQEDIGRASINDPGKAAVNLAQKNVSTAEANLANTQLLAPNDGVITSRNVEVGATVSPGEAIYTLSASKAVPAP